MLTRTGLTEGVLLSISLLLSGGGLAPHPREEEEEEGVRMEERDSRKGPERGKIKLEGKKGRALSAFLLMNM